MKLTHSMIVMFIGSFIVQYFVMSPIMVSKTIYITTNIGKAYLAVIMGLSMVTIQVAMHDRQYGSISTKLYTILFGLIAVFIYLYRKQIAIKDKQYLEAMIEHHSVALHMSDEILKKTDNYNVAKLAKNIIQNQSDELRTMTQLVKKM